MKAITVCQPYAHLLVLPRTDRRHKRVENRTRRWDYRGPIAIHAGKSRKFLQLSPGGQCDEDYKIAISAMAFGAIIGVGELTACYSIEKLLMNEGIPERHRWVASHDHTEGPWCLVIENVRRLGKPIPWAGALGLFEIPDEVFPHAALPVT